MQPMTTQYFLFFITRHKIYIGLYVWFWLHSNRPDQRLWGESSAISDSRHTVMLAGSAAVLFILIIQECFKYKATHPHIYGYICNLNIYHCIMKLAVKKSGSFWNRLLQKLHNVRVELSYPAQREKLFSVLKNLFSTLFCIQMVLAQAALASFFSPALQYYRKERSSI